MLDFLDPYGSGYANRHDVISCLVAFDFDALRFAIMMRNFAAQPSRVSCAERSNESASAGTSRVITLPEPT